MKYKESAGKLAEYRSQIAGIREKMRSAQASIEPEEVQDYEFATPHGKARLSALFGGKDTLFVIHNMGTSCANCTMWADGFNGVFEHLRDRAAFAEDMGYRPNGRAMPGVSVFKRKGDKILRVADTAFSPGDDFCSVWHLFDLIPEGAAGWQPKFTYAC